MRSPIFPKGSLIADLYSFFFLLPCLSWTIPLPQMLLFSPHQHLFPRILQPHLLLPVLISCSHIPSQNLNTAASLPALSFLELLLFSPHPQLPSYQLVCPFFQTLQLSFCLFKLPRCIFPFQHPCFALPCISPQTYPFFYHQLDGLRLFWFCILYIHTAYMYKYIVLCEQRFSYTPFLTPVLQWLKITEPEDVLCSEKVFKPSRFLFPLN